MGVYLKGLTEDGFKEISWECVYLALKRQGRIVEVKEPHGRLIDAYALKRKSQKVATEAWKLRIKATVEVILNQFIDHIDAAPTVIEAEEAKR